MIDYTGIDDRGNKYWILSDCGRRHLEINIIYADGSTAQWTLPHEIFYELLKIWNWKHER